MSDGVYRTAQTPSVRVSLAQRVVDALLILGTLCCHAPPRVDLSQVIRNTYTQAGLLAVVTHNFAEPADSTARGGNSSERRSAAVWCWTIVVITLLGLGLYQDLDRLQPHAMSLWFVVTPILLGLARILVRVSLRAARDRGYNQRVGAVVGSGPLAQQVSQTLIENPSFGIVSKGHFDDTGDELTGTIDELVALCSAGKIDVVYMALPLERSRPVATNRPLQNSTASISSRIFSCSI